MLIFEKFKKIQIYKKEGVILLLTKRHPDLEKTGLSSSIMVLSYLS